MEKITCNICGYSGDAKIYSIKDMLFDMNESFNYFECPDCNCLQLHEIPDNISDFYPKKYSAYNKHKTVKKYNSILRFLKLKKSEFCLGYNKNILGGLMKYFYGGGFIEKLKPANVKFNDKILDVGTGTGGRILDMEARGFTNLTGTDIFIDEEINYENGVKILKIDISEMDDIYDFIMLNHSFEHMSNPLNVMKHLNRLIKNGKYVLIRIPVSDSYSWKKYRENWVGLHAPRHFYLHNKKSMELLAKKSNFILEKVIYDSTDYQFIGSEQYLKNIPAYSENSYFVNPQKSIFTKNDIKKFKTLAKKLNIKEEGDTACFYFLKP